MSETAECMLTFSERIRKYGPRPQANKKPGKKPDSLFGRGGEVRTKHQEGLYDFAPCAIYKKLQS